MMISISGLVSTTEALTPGCRETLRTDRLIFADGRQIGREQRRRALAAPVDRTGEAGRTTRIRLDLVQPAASLPRHPAGPGGLRGRDLEDRAWHLGAADLHAPSHGHGPDGALPRRALEWTLSARHRSEPQGDRRGYVGAPIGTPGGGDA